MSELSLTLLRLGFLVALWLFVFGVLKVLRHDLSGQRNTTPNRAVRQERPRSRRKTHLLVALADGSTRRLELLDAAITFGRGTDNTVLLDDDYTSTHHARVYAHERGWVIEDCGSTNGTWVDRRRITAATPLYSGARIRIGKTDITVKP